MGQIQFIFEEFFRSFKKSLWKDIIYMIIFSIGVLLTVIMSSYYLNLDERYQESVTRRGEAGNWYGLSADYADNFSVWDSAINSLQGCYDCLDYYKEFSSIKNHPTMSIATQQALQMEEKEVKRLFGEKNFECFLDEKNRSSVSAVVEEQVYSIYQMKAAEVDINAFEEYGLEVIKGEGFTKENTTIQNVDEEIPVILGSDYIGIVPLGETTKMGIAGTGYFFKCRVIGFLEAGSSLPFNGQYQGENVLLNDRILFPFGIKLINYGTELKKVQKFAELTNTTLWHSLVLLSSEKEAKNLTDTYAALAKKYHLPAITLAGASMGLELLRSESKENIKIILIMTIVIGVYALWGLVISFYDKIQENKRVYGIYLFNGGSIFMILFSFLLELAVILLPSFSVSYFFIKQERISSLIETALVLPVIWNVIAIIYIVLAIIFSIMLQKIDLEVLIRRKE